MASNSTNRLQDVEVFYFDLLSTVVDWRTTVTRELHALAIELLHSDHSLPSLTWDFLNATDKAGWGRFADRWRGEHKQYTEGHMAGRTGAFGGKDGKHRADTDDMVYRESLPGLLEAWDLGDLYTVAQLDELSLVWRRLAPWADSFPGLRRLWRSPYMTIALCNESEDMQRDLCRVLDFDHFIGPETTGAYKPDRHFYLHALCEQEFEPHQAAMVTADLDDLLAAHGAGMKTVYLQRGRSNDQPYEDPDKLRRARLVADLWLVRESGIIALADMLGVA